MTSGEWAAICKRMIALWPHADWEKNAELGSIAHWGADLQDLSAEVVAAAVDALGRDGREFPPTSGMIRQKAVDLGLDIPEWGVVKAALVRRTGDPSRDSCGECDDGFVWRDDGTVEPCECRELMIERRRRALHPLVAEFVGEVGRGEVRDVDSSRTAEAQVRDKWVSFVKARRRDLVYAGLEPVGLRQLERVSQVAMPMPRDAALTD